VQHARRPGSGLNLETAATAASTASAQTEVAATLMVLQCSLSLQPRTLLPRQRTPLGSQFLLHLLIVNQLLPDNCLGELQQLILFLQKEVVRRRFPLGAACSRLGLAECTLLRETSCISLPPQP
jgi:hypothetical protein